MIKPCPSSSTLTIQQKHQIIRWSFIDKNLTRHYQFYQRILYSEYCLSKLKTSNINLLFYFGVGAKELLVERCGCPVEKSQTWKQCFNKSLQRCKFFKSIISWSLHQLIPCLLFSRFGQSFIYSSDNSKLEPFYQESILCTLAQRAQTAKSMYIYVKYFNFLHKVSIRLLRVKLDSIIRPT